MNPRNRQSATRALIKTLAEKARGADAENDSETAHGFDDDIMVAALRAIRLGVEKPRVIAAQALRAQNPDGCARWCA